MPSWFHQAAPFAVGAIGALIYALRFMHGTGPVERGVNVITGSVLSGFLTPALLEWQKLITPSYLYGAALLLGLLGNSLIAAVVEGIKDTKLGSIISGWLSRRNGGPQA